MTLPGLCSPFTAIDRVLPTCILLQGTGDCDVVDNTSESKFREGIDKVASF